MNCIGPTARSNRPSPSQRPPSVSVIRAVPREPSSAMPTMPGRATPSVPSRLPPNEPWADSTRPIAATRAQSRWHDGSPAASSCSAFRSPRARGQGCRSGRSGPAPRTPAARRTTREPPRRGRPRRGRAGSRGRRGPGRRRRSGSRSASAGTATGASAAGVSRSAAHATPPASRSATGTAAATFPTSRRRVRRVRPVLWLVAADGMLVLLVGAPSPRVVHPVTRYNG